VFMVPHPFLSDSRSSLKCSPTDVTSKTTFQDVEEFHNAILRVKDTDYVPFILVGNKCGMYFQLLSIRDNTPINSVNFCV